MAEGIGIEIADGFARIQFLDRSKAGPALAKLLKMGGPGLIDVDTRSGPRKVYIVPETLAADAGLIEALPQTRQTSSPTGEMPNESWTVAQLLEYAAKEEIELRGATRKADILAAITAALNPS